MDQPCVFQLQPGRNLLAAKFWPGFSSSSLFYYFCFNLRKKTFCVEGGILTGVFAATSVDSCRLIDQRSESWGVCLLSRYLPLQIHPVFSEPLCIPQFTRRSYCVEREKNKTTCDKCNNFITSAPVAQAPHY